MAILNDEGQHENQSIENNEDNQANLQPPSDN